MTRQERIEALRAWAWREAEKAQRLRNAQFSHIKDKGQRLQAMAKAKRAAQARKDARE